MLRQTMYLAYVTFAVMAAITSAAATLATRSKGEDISAISIPLSATGIAMPRLGLGRNAVCRRMYLY
jgi:hypothetical protein